MTLPNFPSAWMSEEHRALEDSVRRFFNDKWVPQAAGWREAGLMPRSSWNEAGAQGLLCLSTPEAYGGAGGDFGHEAVVIMEAARANLSGFGGGLHSAIVAPYLIHCGTEEQRQRLLPRMVTGELASAIAMTEPGTGSDLQAVRTHAKRDGDHYVVRRPSSPTANTPT
jgi:acyl-CoA dehydrogenase